MKKILIVRHGYYSVSDLTSTGREQMKDLGMAIKSLMNGDSIEVKSSTAPRAKQSAKILAEILGVSFTEHEFLWSGPDSPRGCRVDLDKALKIIQGSRADVVILVTHLEYSEYLPTHLGKKICGKDHGFPSEETGKGEAWFIDCQAGTCTWLSPDVAR
jgi:phosphohistidine phosphatase SixA